MSQPIRSRLLVTIVISAFALISGVIVKAQIGVTPYKVNYNWDKLRGIRIGDVKTGWIKAFIPDEEATRGAGTELLGVDAKGRIFSGASGRPGLVMHELFRPLF